MKMDMEKTEGANRGWIAPFFTIWTAQSFSLVGSALVQFSLIWWLTTTTGSSTVLATAALVGLLPQVFLGPIAGALVDRWNRRRIMIAADISIALATVVLILLFAAGKAQIWHVYVLMFVRSLGGAFHWPAMTASTSLMVPKEHLARIQGFNQVLNGGISIISAPLGALALSVLPMQGVLAIDVVTAILAVLPLFFIPIPQPEPAVQVSRDIPRPSVWQDMQAGLRYMWAWPGLLMLLFMATIVNLLLNPGFTLMPILVTRHFNGQAYQLAGIESAFGIGMLSGGLLLGVWGGFKRRIITSMVGLTCLGLANILLGIVPPSGYLVAVAAMACIGIANPITNGPLMAIVQAVVTPEMQGRVLTLIQSAASAMMPIGMILAGPISDRWGVQIWFFVGGLITVLMAVSSLFIPAIMQIENRPAEGKQGDREGITLVAESAD
jgi:DHA3 family macrolide efflux protein-like MFS transporter